MEWLTVRDLTQMKDRLDGKATSTKMRNMAYKRQHCLMEMFGLLNSTKESTMGKEQRGTRMDRRQTA